MRKLTIPTTLIVVLISACASMGSDTNSATGDFNLLLRETEHLVQQADTVGGLWRDTQKLISQAKKAHQQGDLPTAFKRLRKAKKQAELGYQQALEQKNAQPWLF